MRHDLAALTTDDLITLTNRGIVRRAENEVDKFAFELHEAADGTVTCRWSDGAECVLPTDKTVIQWQCTCNATITCRHLIRSVLAYQRTVSIPVGDQEDTERQAGKPWDPGQITDELLAAHFQKATLTRLRRIFEEGHVVELVRSAKPTARIHTLSLVVRFLVPGDVRYTHCDCEEEAPCTHVPLAVWAFRLLEAENPSGIVSTHKTVWPVPAQLLDDVECGLHDLAEAGIAGASQALMDRFVRLADRCRAEGLLWPSEIIMDMIQQHDQYTRHDARFSPTRVAELAGELSIRSRAIRRDIGAVLQVFVRGAEKDRETSVGAARLVGLGCAAETYKSGVTLSAYLQDIDSGMVVAIRRDVADPPPEESSSLPPYWRLAQRPIIEGTGLHSLGSKQLLIKGGTRLADCRFVPGRARATVNPQAFNWEALRAPTLAEDFAEIQARLAAQPPSSLRPRRIAENLYVCPIARVEKAQFSTTEQEVQATLRDASDNQAKLVHPYTSRGQEGTEALLATLLAHPSDLPYVAGWMRLRGGALIIQPISLILQEGQTRTMIQPWVDRWDGETTVRVSLRDDGPIGTIDPVSHFPAQVLDALGELFLIGLQRADAQSAHQWQELYRQGGSLGFVRFLRPMARLVDALMHKLDSVHWDWRAAALAAIEMSILASLAHEDLPAG